MIDQHESIRSLVQSINSFFGENFFQLEDDWNDFYTITFIKDQKLIYISTYNNHENQYYCDCEIATGNEDIPYELYGRHEDVTFYELLPIINNFLNEKEIAQ